MSALSKSHVVEIIPSFGSNFTLPEKLQSNAENAIHKTAITGTLSFDLKFSVHDLFEPSGNHKVLTFDLKSLTPKSSSTFSGHFDDTLFLTGCNLTSWIHDAPFTMLFGSDRVYHSTMLTSRFNKGLISSEFREKYSPKTPIFAADLSAIFYETLGRPTQLNAIEEALAQLQHNGEEMSLQDPIPFFKFSEQTVTFVETFAGVTHDSIMNTVMSGTGKNSNCIVHEESLVGSIAKQMSSSMFVYNGENFSGKEDYILSMSRAKVDQIINGVKGNTEIKGIKGHVQAINDHSKVAPSDITMYLQASKMHDVWRFDENATTLTNQETGVVIPSDHTFTLSFTLTFYAYKADQGPNKCAMDFSTKSLWFYPVFPKKHIDADGKVMKKLDAKGKPTGKFMDPFPIDYVHKPNENATTNETMPKLEKVNTRKRTPAAVASSSSTPLDLTDD